ncbi:hypothetical protein DSCO28_40540 [Desulfosarcina ovata subsp. sediminis]|uniref:Uncharacterized protein n=1 Tax=Desulfosarcina ovata subsp. sediminis TaxID=885957 RepID=A0A5K7ZTF8_9BACT|nr:hypothetical protein [Desulfosarcina ovata]BBO83488.1 hypothetical protein DSCO28_40540 [Desulfosarcina ovata subsp. sediminis]
MNPDRHVTGRQVVHAFILDLPQVLFAFDFGDDEGFECCWFHETSMGAGKLRVNRHLDSGMC